MTRSASCALRFRVDTGFDFESTGSAAGLRLYCMAMSDGVWTREWGAGCGRGRYAGRGRGLAMAGRRWLDDAIATATAPL